MNDFKNILEKYSGPASRYVCPGCGKKEFARYVDATTGEYIDPSVGRCNREDNCGYHLKPKEYFESNNISQENNYHKPASHPVIKQPSYVQNEVFIKSLQTGKSITDLAASNYFIQYLINLFGGEIASELVAKYFIATSKKWNGANIFWQVDLSGKIRSGKIMLYNSQTGKRVKEPYNHITWYPDLKKQPEFNRVQCFFGEHLLKDKTKKIAIVESEKTAIIASVYFSDFIWIATGSKKGINSERKCQALKNRSVILFPDLNAFNEWKKIANEYSHITDFKVSSLLEDRASDEERSKGLDLADYLVRFPFKKFQPKPKVSFAYLDKILLQLMDQKGRVISITDQQEPELFIEACKRLIDYEITNSFNIDLTFSEDFKRLKIMELVTWN